MLMDIERLLVQLFILDIQGNYWKLLLDKKCLLNVHIYVYFLACAVESITREELFLQDNVLIALYSICRCESLSF